MFSLIKKLQLMLSNLKKNKGLFFTIITILSISGIVLFMYLIMTMTSSIKQDVYTSIANKSSQSIDNLLKSHKELYNDLAKIVIAQNETINAIKSVNQNNITNLEAKYNKLFDNKTKYPIIFNFYSSLNPNANYRSTINNLLRSKSEVYGIETQASGVYITYVKPVYENKNFIGLIEIKQSIHSIKKYYEMQDSLFMFMMHKKMLVKLSLKVKTGKFKSVVGPYIVKQGNYSSRFYSTLSEMDEKTFKHSLKVKYDNDEKYFRSYKQVTDINGLDIGLFVFADRIEKNDGFVALVDKMVKSVTYVSLGLVISILLFMF
jgi:hypothetical protein